MTLRAIAQAAGISQGNLTYHYPTKGDLIQELYFDLVQSLDAIVGQAQADTPTLMLLYQSGRMVMEHMQAYRFLLLDFVSIMQSQPVIRDHYLQLQQRRQQEFLFLFGRLQQEGLMRGEQFEGEYRRLYERMNILGDYWINAQQVLYPDRDLTYYLELLLETLYPYLTEQGQAAYRGLFGLGK